MTLTGYFAHLDFIEPLQKELKGIVAQYDRLFLCEGNVQESVWAQNIWYDVEKIHFTSIKDGAKKLRSIQRNWMPFSFSHHRRMELLVQELPKLTAKRLNFLEVAPSAPLGAFTLIDSNWMLTAAKTSSPWPHGMMEFQEDKTNPPSRAYLKLWDVFTRLGWHPIQGSTAIELGASPGGWTWVLNSLGCKVYAFDRSELDAKLMKNDNIVFKKGDAFQAKPQDYPDVDWVFSDLICYPEKLLEFLQPWLADEKKRNFVCTLKFQGENPYGVLEEFKKIPQSRIIHLYHNKHEVTWVLLNNELLLNFNNEVKKG